MESYKLGLKFFVQDASGLAGHEFVPVFHKWIQTHAVADHLAIDVADYQHVHQGPGTLLITHEANFATDRGNGELGLLYVRKQPFANAATFAERLRVMARTVLEAAQRLENEPTLAGKTKFRTGDFAFRIYDRLLGPSNAETFAAVKPELQKFVTELWGSAPAALEFAPSSESLFEVRVKASSSPTVAGLLKNLPVLVAVH